MLAALAVLMAGALAIPALAIVAVLGATGTGGACLPAGPVTVGAGALPDAVGGYRGEQLANAATIIATGAELGVPARGQAIAVMTAMGENSLRVIDHGDAAGPDSRGLFQQRDNGAWGTYADRMDPATSAAMFYRALLAVPGWDALEPSAAAHAVQRNADPDHYTPYWQPALEVIRALTGAAAEITGCVGGGAAVGPGGWANPAVGRLTSGFGKRVHPVLGTVSMHTGQDIASDCGTPIYAAAAGTVTWSGGAHQGRTGNQIVIDHGGGIITRYGHLLTGTLLVPAGDVIAAGQRIASMGGDPALDPAGAGNSTGCHLHFEVNTNAGRSATDPMRFLEGRNSAETPRYGSPGADADWVAK